MEKIAKVIAREVVEMAVKIAATTNVIPALARALVSMRRARPGPFFGVGSFRDVSESPGQSSFQKAGSRA